VGFQHLALSTEAHGGWDAVGVAVSLALRSADGAQYRVPGSARRDGSNANITARLAPSFSEQRPAVGQFPQHLVQLVARGAQKLHQVVVTAYRGDARGL
jgi:hypothetical protein